MMDDGLVSVFLDGKWQRITPEQSIKLSADSGEALQFVKREWPAKEPVYAPILKRHGYRRVAGMKDVFFRLGEQ